jgi:hypothetical protein
LQSKTAAFCVKGAAFEDGSSEIRVAVWRDGAFVKCSVQDNGLAPAKIQPGRGLKIVDALSKALGRPFQQTFGARGSKSLLIFPYDSELMVIAGTRRREAGHIPEHAA